MSDFNTNRPPIPGAPDPRQPAGDRRGYDPRGSQDDVQASNPLYAANGPQYGEPQYGEPQDNQPQYGESQANQPQYGDPLHNDLQANAPQAGDPQGYEPQANGPQYNAPQAGDPLGYDPQANDPQGEPWHDTAVHAPIPTAERLTSDDVPLREYVPGTGGGQGKGGKGGMSNTLKSVLLGLGSSVVGGAVVAALFSFTPLGAVQSGATSATTAASPTTAATEQVNGQTITLNGDDDTTLANAVSAKALPSVVSVYVSSQQGSGMGSGVILDKEGHVLTNYHVAGGADELSVQLNGKSYSATILGSDSSSDLAVLTVDFGDTEVTPIERGDSSTLSVGDWVMTVGSPFGLDQSVSSGIVSSLYRHTMVSDSSGNTVYANLIQVDAAINPGNSGGALVDNKGRLVGISTLYTSSTQSFAGIGFAIDGNYALRIADTIIAGKPVEHAYIGLSMGTVNAQAARQNNLSVNQGAYIGEVEADGPAAKAGLKVGDVITAIDGTSVTSADAVILAVRAHTPGDTVQVTYMRGSEELTATVTLGSDGGKDVAGQSSQQQTQSPQQYQDQRQEYYNFDEYYQWLEQLLGVPTGRR